jgi:hypothetical protein
MAKVSEIAKYVWQTPTWPNFQFSRAALADELSLFAKAFADAKRALKNNEDNRR